MLFISEELGHLVTLTKEYLGFAGGSDCKFFWVSVKHFNEVLQRVKEEGMAVIKDCTSRVVKEDMFSRIYVVEKTPEGLMFGWNLITFERLAKMRTWLLTQGINLVDLNS